MNAEILAVGTELLLGQIVNTNAQYLSEQLASLGINVFYHEVVGDNKVRLTKTLHTALDRSDIIITTGGLGPTNDDLTKEVIAQAMGKKLVLDQTSLDRITQYIKKLNIPMAKTNEKQAYLPEGCIILPNDNGTAPGCIIENDKNVVIMLPGPPREMKLMFSSYVKPYLERKSSTKLVSRVLRIFGIGESELAQRYMDLLENSVNPTVAPYAKEGEVTLRITAGCKDEQEGLGLIQPVIDKLKSEIGDFIYSCDDELMEEVVVKKLAEKNMKLSCAESCTGGMIASLITNVSGASQVFEQGIVTYSNSSKMQYLNVNAKTLEKYGAVSEQTAREMALGIKNASQSDIAVSVTGIAGPTGGTAEKKVGLVYIAVADSDGVSVREFNFTGSRDRVRRLSCLNALDMVRRRIK